MASRRIFVSWPGYTTDDPETGGRLIAAGYDVALHPKTGARSADELASLLDDAVGAIVSTDPFESFVLQRATSLRVIARVGVGVDSIDRAAADARGIAIAITPGLNAETVADHTLALILALVRKVVIQDAALRAGRWDRVGAMAPTELADKTVGLIGAGQIGRAVIRRLRGFNVRILVCDPVAPENLEVELAATPEELIRQADIISLHAPLTSTSRHLLNAARLALAKPTTLVVNTSRGGLVDQAALFEALRRGRIAGAALDVFETEPPEPASFADVPNLIVSPHLGGISRESVRRMTISATESVLSVLKGAIPPTIINPDVLTRRPAIGT